MKTLMTSLFVVTSAALAAAGCGDTPEMLSVAPSISITAPSSNATSTLGTDAQLSLPITFTTTNFLLKAPNSDGCGVGCGHVHLLIDGSACNMAQAQYNNEG